MLGGFVRLVEERFGPNVSLGESWFSSLSSSGAHADLLHRNVFLAVKLAVLFEMDFLAGFLSCPASLQNMGKSKIFVKHEHFNNRLV